MLKKLISMVVPVIMLFTSICVGYAAESATASAGLNIQVTDGHLYNAEGEVITGRIEPGTEVTASVTIYSAESTDIKYSVYMAVFEDGKLEAVGKSAVQTAAAGALNPCEVKCKIPETVGQNYYIALFHLMEETLAPLCDVITFAASEAYSTEVVTYNGTNYVLGREVVTDPSFENDNLVTNGWNSKSASDIMRSADYVLDGNYSCKVYSREHYYDAIRQSVTDRLKEEGSGTYQVTYSVRPTESVNFQLILRQYVKDGTNQGTTLGTITSAEANEWNTFSGFKDITVKSELHNVDLYCESTSGSADFYIDKCSMRRLISYPEYIMQNAYTKDADIDAMFTQLIEQYGENTRVVHPKDSDKIIKNPYKGLNYYTTKLDFSSLDLTQPGAQISNVVYARYGWSKLEPEDGVYKFDEIDKNIEILKEKNMKLGIGIGATVCYNSASSYEQQTPEWLFETYKAKHYDLTIGSDTMKIPIYNDPIFMEKMQRFLTAFAEHYNGNPNIAFVDMRNYGNWGEWHFSSSVFNDYKSQYSYLAKDLTNLVDMFKDFELPLLMFTSDTAALNYAVDTYGTGVRVDGVLNPDVFDNHLKMKFVDGRNFSVAEWYMQPESFYEGGSYSKYYDYLPIYIEKVVREGAASYISLGYWNPEEFYSRFTDLSNRLANRTGYWLKPIRITYPESLTEGVFTMTVKNDGSTQLYAGYKRNAAVKLALADGGGNIVDTVTLGNADPEDWKAGKISYVGGEYKFTNTEGAEKLYLGIFSDADNDAPDIKLGTYDEPTADGWYDLSNMTESENVSDSRLYTASLPYADLSYGYRDPYYAFDKNGETYFASEIREGEYMEVSFGEYVNVSSVSLEAKGGAAASVSVMGYNGKEWTELFRTDKINDGINSFSFEPSYISKLRLKFNETKLNNILKITEMRVN